MKRQYGEMSARNETVTSRIQVLEEQLSELNSKDQELSAKNETVSYIDVLFIYLLSTVANCCLLYTSPSPRDRG